MFFIIFMQNKGKITEKSALCLMEENEQERETKHTKRTFIKWKKICFVGQIWNRIYKNFTSDLLSKKLNSI